MKQNIEMEKPPTGIFEKPKLKSARSLRKDMDDLSSNDSDINIALKCQLYAIHQQK
jgi:hypothetical protein